MYERKQHAKTNLKYLKQTCNEVIKQLGSQNKVSLDIILAVAIVFKSLYTFLLKYRGSVGSKKIILF